MLAFKVHNMILAEGKSWDHNTHTAPTVNIVQGPPSISCKVLYMRESAGYLPLLLDSIQLFL